MSDPIPQVRPRELVLLARDFNRLVDWYVQTLGFKVLNRIDELPYANLETEGGVRLGIGSAPPDVTTSDATIVPQLETTDVSGLLLRVRTAGGLVDGPHRDAALGFDFGSFKDPEGNIWWVVDEKAP